MPSMPGMRNRDDCIHRAPGQLLEGLGPEETQIESMPSCWSSAFSTAPRRDHRRHQHTPSDGGCSLLNQLAGECALGTTSLLARNRHDPPCASTTRRTKERPRPLPVGFV